jgi:hypothetical protein
LGGDNWYSSQVVVVGSGGLGDVELLLYSSSSSQQKKQRYMTTTATDTRKNAVDYDTSNMLTMLGKEERGGLARRLWKRKYRGPVVTLPHRYESQLTDLEQAPWWTVSANQKEKPSGG